MEISLKGSDGKGLNGIFKLYAPAKYYKIYPYQEVSNIKGVEYIQIRNSSYGDVFKTNDGIANITKVSVFSGNNELRARNIEEFVILQESTENGYSVEKEPIFSNSNGEFVVINKKTDENKFITLRIIDEITEKLVDDSNIKAVYSDKEYKYWYDTYSEIVGNKFKINENQRAHFLHKIRSDNYWTSHKSKEITDNEIEDGQVLIKLYPKSHGMAAIVPYIVEKVNNSIETKPYEGKVEIIDSQGRIVETLEYKKKEIDSGRVYIDGEIINEDYLTKWLPVEKYTIRITDDNGEIHKQELNLDEENLDEYGQMIKVFRITPVQKIELNKIDKYVRTKLKGAEFSIYRVPGIKEKEKIVPRMASLTFEEKEPIREYDEPGEYYNYKNQAWKLYKKIAIDENGNIKILGENIEPSSFLKLAILEDALGGYFGDEILATEYKYIIIETKAPEGYIVNPTPIEVEKIKYKAIKLEIIPQNQSVRAKKVYANDVFTEEEVTLKLYRQIEGGNLEEVANAPELTFNADMEYVEWKDVDLKDQNGNPYIFVAKDIRENGIEFLENGVNLSNEPKERNIKVIKKWLDENGREMNKTEGQTEAVLFADGIAVEKFFLNASNNWAYKFSGLPVLNDKKEPINYSIEEIGEKDGYISFGEDRYLVKVEGNVVDGFVIKNKIYKIEKPIKPDPINPTTPIINFDAIGVKSLLNKKDHYQYLIGYKDITFKPENNMTRQEVTVMFSRLLNNRPEKGRIYSRDYKDVEDSLWSVTGISYMSKLGLIKGYPDGNFRPYESITRAEFAAIASRFDKLEIGNKTFTDVPSNHWAYEDIKKATEAGWISGYPDGTFKPDQPITRAEVVTITNRMLNRYADQEFVENNKDKIINYIDIDKSHWAYYPVVEATNGHEYTRRANGKDEIWSKVNEKTFVYDK